MKSKSKIVDESLVRIGKNSVKDIGGLSRIAVKEFTSSKFGKYYLIRDDSTGTHINLRKILDLGNVKILDEISYVDEFTSNQNTAYVAKTSKRAIAYGLDTYLKNKFKISEIPSISYLLEIIKTTRNSIEDHAKLVYVRDPIDGRRAIVEEEYFYDDEEIEYELSRIYFEIIQFMAFTTDISLKIYDNNPKSLLLHCLSRKGEYVKIVNLESSTSLYELKKASKLVMWFQSKKLFLSRDLELTDSLNSDYSDFTIVDFVEEI